MGSMVFCINGWLEKGRIQKRQTYNCQQPYLIGFSPNLSLSLCLYVCTLFNATVLNVVAEVFSRLTISARGCSTNIVVRRDS